MADSVPERVTFYAAITVALSDALSVALYATVQAAQVVAPSFERNTAEQVLFQPSELLNTPLLESHIRHETYERLRVSPMLEHLVQAVSALPWAEKRRVVRTNVFCQ